MKNVNLKMQNENAKLKMDSGSSPECQEIMSIINKA
jgi:hypothetical protein